MFFFRRTILTNIFLLFDTITSIRFIFIFLLQNPGAFNDEFWSLFINIWISGASVSIQFVKAYLEKLKLFHYSICIGQAPEKSNEPVESMFGVELLSIVLQIVLYSFIKCRQTKFPDIRNHKRADLAFMERHSLVKFSCHIYLYVIFIFLVAYFLASKSTPSGSNVKNPNSSFTPFTFLIFPSLIPLAIVTFLFLNNPTMRNFLFKEMKIYFGH